MMKIGAKKRGGGCCNFCNTVAELCSPVSLSNRSIQDYGCNNREFESSSRKRGTDSGRGDRSTAFVRSTNFVNLANFVHFVHSTNFVHFVHSTNFICKTESYHRIASSGCYTPLEKSQRIVESQHQEIPIFKE